MRGFPYNCKIYDVVLALAIAFTIILMYIRLNAIYHKQLACFLILVLKPLKLASVSTLFQCRPNFTELETKSVVASNPLPPVLSEWRTTGRRRVLVDTANFRSLLSVPR